MPDFLPSRENELLTWSASMSQQISADPGAFSVSQQDADRLAAAVSSYASAFRTAFEPRTNSTVARGEKRESKKALKLEVRRVARIIRAAGVAEPKLLELGLRRHDSTLTPSQTPDTPPELQLGPCTNGILPIRLQEKDATRRGRPRATAGAMVFVHYGDEAPPDVDAWSKQMLTGRTRVSIIIPPATPLGTRLWITACWLGTRLQRGPVAFPLSTRVLGGALVAPSATRLAA
jgi:hypothetical protein